MQLSHRAFLLHDNHLEAMINYFFLIFYGQITDMEELVNDNNSKKAFVARRGWREKDAVYSGGYSISFSVFA